MKNLFFTSILSFLMILSGCSIFNQSGKLYDAADIAYKEGRIEEALDLHIQIIESNKEKNHKVEGELYYRTGMIAYEIGNTSKAIEYLELARLNSFINTESLIALAKSYKEVNNLSLEIRRLEDYIENFPSGEEIAEVRKWYFLLLVESMTWEQAIDAWSKLEGDPYQEEALVEGYFLANKVLENEEITEELAEKLLKLNTINKVALEWYAKKYYYKAAKRYTLETEAYEKNRTNKQYAKLLDAWSLIHDDFRTSRNYFEQLYKNYPSSEYATFLANIYERLKDDAKAKYYRKRAN
jgi:hypothetical protein